MAATSKGAVCPCLPYGGGYMYSTYLMFCVSCQCCCACCVCVWSVHCGVLCAAWWRAAITRLVTRYKTLHCTLKPYIIICTVHLITLLRLLPTPVRKGRRALGVRVLALGALEDFE